MADEVENTIGSLESTFRIADSLLVGVNAALKMPMDGTHLNKDQYLFALRLVGAIGRLARAVPAPSLLNTMEHAESIGSILDPTLFRTFLYDKKAQADFKALKAMTGHIWKIAEEAETLIAVHEGKGNAG